MMANRLKLLEMVPGTGIEPVRTFLGPTDFKSVVKK